MTTVVVLDIDDTLYLEREYVRSGFAAVGRWVEQTRGDEGFGEACWRSFLGGVRGDTFGRVLRERGLNADPEVVSTLIDVYRNHRPNIHLADDATVCLQEINGRAALACVTDGPMLSQRAKSAALGLDLWLDPILFTSELGPGYAKPSPASFALIEERFSVPGPECAYLADNPMKDFAGPASLGWTTVRVRRPESLHQLEPSRSDVSVEVSSLHAVAELLGITPA